MKKQESNYCSVIHPLHVRFLFESLTYHQFIVCLGSIWLVFAKEKQKGEKSMMKRWRRRSRLKGNGCKLNCGKKSRNLLPIVAFLILNTYLMRNRMYVNFLKPLLQFLLYQILSTSEDGSPRHFSIRLRVKSRKRETFYLGQFLTESNHFCFNCSSKR